MNSPLLQELYAILYGGTVNVLCNISRADSDADVFKVHAGDRGCLSVVGGEGVVTVFRASWNKADPDICVPVGMGIETYSGEQIDIYLLCCV